jgi:hypothetical protein
VDRAASPAHSGPTGTAHPVFPNRYPASFLSPPIRWDPHIALIFNLQSLLPSPQPLDPHSFSPSPQSRTASPINTPYFRLHSLHFPSTFSQKAPPGRQILSPEPAVLPSGFHQIRRPPVSPRPRSPPHLIPYPQSIISCIHLVFSRRDTVAPSKPEDHRRAEHPQPPLVAIPRKYQGYRPRLRPSLTELNPVELFPIASNHRSIAADQSRATLAGNQTLEP